MSEDRVIAVCFRVDEIGKRVSDSKKKFLWEFRIGGNAYRIVLMSSALSGKRLVTLNESEIYSEKNVLNTNFDFMHSIEGHSIRIHRDTDSVNNFKCRVDNRSFDYLLKKNTSGNPNAEKRESKFTAKNDDPFSEFSSFADNKAVLPSNEFGDFEDFKSFQFSKPQVPSTPVPAEHSKPSPDLFQFEAKEEECGVDSFEKNFQEADLLGKENEFATNTYGQYSNYLDLMQGDQECSDAWGTPQPEAGQKGNTLLDRIKPDITAKQAKNKTLMTAVELKKKASNLLDL